MTTKTRGFLDLVVVRYLRQKPQLLIAIVLGVIALVACQILTPLKMTTNSLIGWNVMAIFYLGMGIHSMFSAERERLTQYAHLYDDGEGVILILSIVAAALSFVAIVFELATSKNATGALRGLHVGLSALTLLTSWAFIHTAFAFHYAHGYYSALARNPKAPCLIFPGKDAPHYTDFLYFAFVIGTSGQTADVDFASMETRRTGLVHCVIAYLFNATVLALTINIAASLV